MGFEEKLVWKTPELIVLVRSKPEEAVLQACKDTTLSGAVAHKNGCTNSKGCNKGTCATLGSS